MPTISIEGDIPLIGDVSVSGDTTTALVLISAALFCDSTVVLENVPKTGRILNLLRVIESIGGSVSWFNATSVAVSGATIQTSSIPYESFQSCDDACLLVGPILFRLGEATIPLCNSSFVSLWERLGLFVEVTAHAVHISLMNRSGVPQQLKLTTCFETGCAILSTIFMPNDITLHIPAEELIVDSLIDFCNTIGGSITRVSVHEIKVSGSTMFSGATFEVPGNVDEAILFMVAALVTRGNVTISRIMRPYMTSFLHIMTKIGCSYEFYKDSIRVWVTQASFNPTRVTIMPAPGLRTLWQAPVTLLLTYASGESLVSDPMALGDFSYVRELNRMGAKIELFETKQTPDASTNTYYTAKIFGPTKLRGTRLNISDIAYDSGLVLAALSASGKSILQGSDFILWHYADFWENLTNLGAQISAI